MTFVVDIGFATSRLGWRGKFFIGRGDFSSENHFWCAAREMFEYFLDGKISRTAKFVGAKFFRARRQGDEKFPGAWGIFGTGMRFHRAAGIFFASGKTEMPIGGRVVARRDAKDPNARRMECIELAQHFCKKRTGRGLLPSKDE